MLKNYQFLRNLGTFVCFLLMHPLNNRQYECLAWDKLLDPKIDVSFYISNFLEKTKNFHSIPPPIKVKIMKSQHYGNYIKHPS